MGHREDVVITAHPFVKPEQPKQLTQALKWNVGVRTPHQYELVQVIMLAHAARRIPQPLRIAKLRMGDLKDRSGGQPRSVEPHPLLEPHAQLAGEAVVPCLALLGAVLRVYRGRLHQAVAQLVELRDRRVDFPDVFLRSRNTLQA